MTRFLLLRLEAPLMSFGGVMVDQRGTTRDYPSQSMLTGLLANALGYDHADVSQLERLQQRLHFAVRQDRAGEAMVDYQTVDLGQAFMRQGWTTYGAPQGRGGGAAKTGTHIRYRSYLADAIYTVALGLRSAEEDPGLETLAEALRHPARPIFLGRKPCIPSRPLVHALIDAESPRSALQFVPSLGTRSDDLETFQAWWAYEGEGGGDAFGQPVTDHRDWANQVHVGRRFLQSGRLAYREVPDDEA